MLARCGGVGERLVAVEAAPLRGRVGQSAHPRDLLRVRDEHHADLCREVMQFGDDGSVAFRRAENGRGRVGGHGLVVRSEEHTSELLSLMRISYAVFCLNKKTKLHTK